MPRVKLCGLGSEASVLLALAHKPDAVGLVFADSTRQITADQAAGWLGVVPDHVTKIAVFRTPSEPALARIRHLPFDGVQAHADWNGSGLPASWFFLPVFLDGPDLLDRITGTRGDGWDHSFCVDGPKGGGMGVRVDVKRAAKAATMGNLVLAGGLNPDNVTEAILQVQPWGVDVSSGIEAGIPGEKDPSRVRDFVIAARAGDRSDKR